MAATFWQHRAGFGFVSEPKMPIDRKPSSVSHSPESKVAYSRSVIGEIVGLQRAEFDRAARLQKRILYFQVAITLLACTTVYVSNTVLAYTAALMAVAVALLWARTDYLWSESRAQAERARRATLLTDGLGWELSAAEVRDLRSQFSVKSNQGKLFEDPAYYAAKALPGPQRLVEMLEETGFWTRQLFRYSANRFWFLFALFLTFLFLLLLGSIPFVNKQELLGAVRVACAMLVLLVSTDLLGRALDYTRAFHTLDGICQRIKQIKSDRDISCDLLMILCDYNSAVESAPMPASGIYERHRDELNRMWKES
jgi:hypothetical protein